MRCLSYLHVCLCLRVLTVEPGDRFSRNLVGCGNTPLLATHPFFYRMVRNNDMRDHVLNDTIERANVWARHLTADGIVIGISKSVRLVFRCVESKSAKWLSHEIICSFPLALGYAVAQLTEALRYKPEGHGFNIRLCYWNFLLTQSFRPQYGLGG